jgi:hypothetical protein
LYKATQYNKRGDHRFEYVWSIATPIIDEEEGLPWPESGRLGSLDECKPENLRYSVFVNEEHKSDIGGKDFFEVNLTDWILEIDGSVVGVISDEQYRNRFEIVEN